LNEQDHEDINKYSFFEWEKLGKIGESCSEAFASDSPGPRNLKVGRLAPRPIILAKINRSLHAAANMQNNKAPRHSTFDIAFA
jgi:hypothetical protein